MKKFQRPIVPFVCAVIAFAICVVTPAVAMLFTKSDNRQKEEVSDWGTKQQTEMWLAELDFRLGMEYYDGDGVKQDYAEAAKCLLRAAEHGHVFAQNNLGNMYCDGLGVKQDYAQAVYWFSKAAAQGNSAAQANLGYMYAFGVGVKQDYSQAAYWYRKAAEQGIGLAQYNLGVMYENGDAVEQDYDQAAYWYGRAAEQGFNMAQENLNDLNQRRYKVEQDYTDTYSDNEPPVITKVLPSGRVVTYTPRRSRSSSSNEPDSCAFCGGTGRCIECEGSGVERWKAGEPYRKCWKCAGSGRCRECLGTGRAD